MATKESLRAAKASRRWRQRRPGKRSHTKQQNGLRLSCSLDATRGVAGFSREPQARRLRGVALTDAVISKVASYATEVVDLTAQLVKVPTENPPGAACANCVDVLHRELQRLGISHRVARVPAFAPSQYDPYPRYCVIAEHGSGGRILYFHGHYDVVPAHRLDQFEPRIEQGRLYGRGSCDMKSGLAAMIFALRALKELEVELAGRIRLCLVPDEETGGRRGSHYLSEAGFLKAHGLGMMTAEPTGGLIWNAARGAFSLKVTVRGRSAHVGLQHQGINAFEELLAVARAVTDLKAEVERQETAFKLTPAIARHSILMVGGRVEGGTNFNVVPAECSFTIDRRINPEENFATEKGRLLDLLERLRSRGRKLDYEVLQEALPSGTREDEPLVQVLADAVEAVTGRRPRCEMCPGILETRFYVQSGTPAVAYGPGLLKVAHGPEEWVGLEAVQHSTAVYALTAARLLSPQCC